MNFSNPLWLPAGAFACVALCLLWYRYDRRQRMDLLKIVSVPLRQNLTRSLSVARRRLQRMLQLGAIACLSAALAGPQLGFRWEEITSRGNDIVFAIDTSRSMLTPDVRPDRLTRAKLAIDDISAQLQGDALGIVAFAGSAFLVCPITLDYGAFQQSLIALDTHTIPRGGTNISTAIRVSQGALHRRPGGDKILILLTDGEDLEGDALVAAQNAAKLDGLKIFTVGVGTESGELIPLPSDQGGGFVKDEQGAPVKSRLDEAALKRIAAATGGVYAALGSQGEGLEIFTSALSTIAKHNLQSRRQKIYTERFQWPLGASLCMLLLSLTVGSRRRTGSRRAAVPVPAVLILIAACAAIGPLRAADSKPDPPHAVAGDIREPVQQYNAGTSAYRAGQFPSAIKSFQQSIRQSPSADPKRLIDQQDAYYNLGNTLYRLGQKSEQSAREDTRKRWQDAIKAYDTALQLRPDDADSRFNRDYVQRKLDELNQPPPPNPQQNPNQKPPPNPSGAPPPGSPPPGSPPPGASPPAPPKGDQSPPKGDQSRPKGDQSPPPPRGAPPEAATRTAGQMSAEEAQQLLDSAKSEERTGLRAPIDSRDPNQPPEKPFKDW